MRFTARQKVNFLHEKLWGNDTRPDEFSNHLNLKCMLNYKSSGPVSTPIYIVVLVGRSSSVAPVEQKTPCRFYFPPEWDLLIEDDPPLKK